MSSVIRGAEVRRAPRLLGANAEVLVDPAVEALVERARDEGYRRGFEDGRRRGLEEVRRAAEILRAGLREVEERLHRSQAEAAEELLAAALEIAGFVVGAVPVAPEALGRRIAEALERLDDERLRVILNPDDRDGVVAALAGAVDLDVVVDPAMPAGSARLEGRWATAEFAPEIAMEAVRRALA